MYTQDRCWAFSSRVWEQSMMYPNLKNEPSPPLRSFQILPLTWGGSDMPSALKAEVMDKHQESLSDSSHAGGGNGYREMFFFGIRDKIGGELSLIQMLTLHDACLVYRVEDSGRFLMIYHSLRSHNPVLTLWLLLGFASPTKYFVCVCV